MSNHLSEEELAAQLEQAKNQVEIGAIYAHYRDPKNIYKVVGIGVIDATQEPGVIYKKERGSDFMKSVLWVRSIHIWLEQVTVEGTLVPRFQKVKN